MADAIQKMMNTTDANGFTNHKQAGILSLQDHDNPNQQLPQINTTIIDQDKRQGGYQSQGGGADFGNQNNLLPIVHRQANGDDDEPDKASVHRSVQKQIQADAISNHRIQNQLGSALTQEYQTAIQQRQSLVIKAD